MGEKPHKSTTGSFEVPAYLINRPSDSILADSLASREDFKEFIRAQQEKISKRARSDRVIRLKIAREKLSQHILLADKPTEVKIIPSQSNARFIHPLRDMMRYNVRLATLVSKKHVPIKIAFGTYGAKTSGSISAKLRSILAVNGEYVPTHEPDYFHRQVQDLSTLQPKNHYSAYILEMQFISDTLSRLKSDSDNPAIAALANNFETRQLYERSLIELISVLEYSHRSNSGSFVLPSIEYPSRKLFNYVMAVEGASFKLHESFVSQRKNNLVDTLEWAHLPLSAWPEHQYVIDSFWGWAQKNNVLSARGDWADAYIRLIERTRFSYSSTHKTGSSAESVFANPNKIDYLEAFLECLKGVHGLRNTHLEQINSFVDSAMDYERRCDLASEALSYPDPSSKIVFLSSFMWHYSSLLEKTQRVLEILNGEDNLPGGANLRTSSANSRRLLIFYLAHLSWTDLAGEKKLLTQIRDAVVSFSTKLSSLLPDEKDWARLFSESGASPPNEIISKIDAYISSIEMRTKAVQDLFSKIESERKVFKARRNEIHKQLEAATKKYGYMFPVHTHCVNVSLDHAQSHSSFKSGFWRPEKAAQIFAPELLGLSALYLLSQEIYSRSDNSKNFKSSSLWRNIPTPDLEDMRDNITHITTSILNCNSQILNQLASNYGAERVFFELISADDEGLWNIEQDVRDQLGKSALTKFTNKEVEATRLELSHKGETSSSTTPGQTSISFEDKYNRFSISYGEEDLQHALDCYDKSPCAQYNGFGNRISTVTPFSYQQVFASISEHMIADSVYQSNISGIYEEAFFSKNLPSISYNSLEYLLAALADGADFYKGSLILFQGQVYEIPANGLLPNYPSPQNESANPPQNSTSGAVCAENCSQQLLHLSNQRLQTPFADISKMKESFLEQKRIWRIIQEQGRVTSKFVRALDIRTAQKFKL